VTACQDAPPDAGSVTGSGYAREAVLILPQRLIAHRPPALVTAEIRPDQQRAMRPGQHRHEPGMPAPGTGTFSYAA